MPPPWPTLPSSPRREPRSHHAPLAFPCCPAAPSRRPRPLSRVRQRRTACIAPCTLDFAASAPRSPATPRSPRRLPELADASDGSAVSPAAVSPSPFCHSRAVAVLTTGPERSCRRGSSPSWPEPSWLKAGHTTVLQTSLGARRTHQLPLPSTTTPNPQVPELRPPPWSSPPSTQATPAPLACSIGCARARAPCRTPPRVEWAPEQPFRRATAASGRCRRLDAGGLAGLTRDLTPLGH